MSAVLTGFDGRVALVTGAGQGIGEAVALALGAAGCVVAAADLDGGNAATTAQTIREVGGRAEGWTLDVREAAGVERVVAEIEAKLGPIHHLVNIAGIVPRGPLVEVTDELWERLIATNVTGVFHCLRSVAKRMIPRKAGAIVTIGSQGGVIGRFEMAPYAASKAGAAALTKTLGIELGRYGIRCNVVHPGIVATKPILERWPGDAASFDAKQGGGDPAAYRAPIPLNKAARVEDVASSVLWLLSDQAGHVTMEDIVVDGGATFRL